MAFGKKPSSSKSSPAKAAAPISKAPPVSSTPVRNSAVPPKLAVAAPAARKAVTHDQISTRAYEIWRSGRGGSEAENWLRAERELKGI